MQPETSYIIIKIEDYSESMAKISLSQSIKDEIKVMDFALRATDMALLWELGMSKKNEPRALAQGSFSKNILSEKSVQFPSSPHCLKKSRNRWVPCSGAMKSTLLRVVAKSATSCTCLLYTSDAADE